MDSTGLLQLGRQILANQSFSRLLGAELTAFDGTTVELTIPMRDDFKQQYGFVHGGVFAYAADNALTFAGALVLGPGVITSEFKINYVRPGRGDRIVARGSVVYGGKTQAVVRADIFMQATDAETLVAVAQGTIVKMAGAPANTD